MNLSDAAVFGALTILYALFGLAVLGTPSKPRTLRASTVRYLQSTQKTRPSRGFVAIDPATFVGGTITVLPKED